MAARPPQRAVYYLKARVLIQLTSSSPPRLGAGHLLRLLANQRADRMAVCWNFLSPFVSGNRKAGKGRHARS